MYGVEPHPDLAAVAARRTARLANVTVLPGTAQRVPLAPATVDVMQARWAYFFGPGCEPGLRELDRVMRRGGTAFVVDNDSSRSTFGGVVPARLPERRRRRGGAVLVRARLAAPAARRRVAVRDRADLEACVRIELDEHGRRRGARRRTTALEVDYAVNLWWKRF